MAPECMLKLYAAGYAQKQDYPALMQVIRDGLKYNLLQGKSKTYFVMSNLSKFVNCQDRTVQELVVKFVDELIAGIQDPFERSSYFRMKSILLDAYGDKESAAKAKEKAEENAREGKLKNEGNGVRSVKMMQ